VCFSTVYLEEKNGEKMLLEEVSQISCNGETVDVLTLFAERKSLQGYAICEVNLIENYIILARKECKTHGRRA